MGLPVVLVVLVLRVVAAAAAAAALVLVFVFISFELVSRVCAPMFLLAAASAVVIFALLTSKASLPLIRIDVMRSSPSSLQRVTIQRQSSASMPNT